MDERADNLERKIDKRKLREKRSEDQSVVESVFDTETQKIIYQLYNRKILDEIEFVIATGKEANVYYAIGPKGEDFAVKIYRIKTAETRFMWPYIIGDPRFKNIRHKTRDLIFAWAEKEFKNLSRAKSAKVRVPTPIAVRKNVLVMEFLGNSYPDSPFPYPLLKDSCVQPQKTYAQLIENIKILYQSAKLVHGDLSEFNILNKNSSPIIIDLSHAISTLSPASHELLQRDIANICRFFNKKGLKLSPAQIYGEITKGK